MNGYICFYKGKKFEVKAESTYQAQQEGAQHFKAKKPWQVTTMLAEKEGKQVVHKPSF